MEFRGADYYFAKEYNESIREQENLERRYLESCINSNNRKEEIISNNTVNINLNLDVSKIVNSVLSFISNSIDSNNQLREAIKFD